ncbi:MAG: DtxR family transcriptional regulator [Gemmatimonadota bacterium]|nr:MAG: DtxR family transcriptional regulator [Gemmatimonadota bacterium]
MVDPALALLVFAVILGLTVVAFWPRRGIVARLGRLVRLTERARVEDALKHLHESEYAGKPATMESVAGALGMSRARAAQLVARLEGLGLARSEGETLTLSGVGRSQALRVLRTHRLWERYLADRTGVLPADWHDEAETREHTLSGDQVEQLAAAMGDPRYDPHGDPIPTADGELPPRKGFALTDLRPGQRASVVHLEDEPREIFEQLLRLGLAPRTQVEIVSAGPHAIRFTADGQEFTLEPVAARNVTVAAPLLEDERGPFESLSSLRPGEEAEVLEISPVCQGPQRRRLLDLGVVPGTVITAELEGAMRDPVAYRIRGALIALRREQAGWIRVTRA